MIFNCQKHEDFHTKNQCCIDQLQHNNHDEREDSSCSLNLMSDITADWCFLQPCLNMLVHRTFDEQVKVASLVDIIPNSSYPLISYPVIFWQVNSKNFLFSLQGINCVKCGKFTSMWHFWSNTNVLCRIKSVHNIGTLLKQKNYYSKNSILLTPANFCWELVSRKRNKNLCLFNFFFIVFWKHQVS